MCMRRSGLPPEFDSLDEPECYLHIHSKLKSIMSAAETQEQLIQRLTRELAAKDTTIANERTAREQANAREASKS